MIVLILAILGAIVGVVSAYEFFEYGFDRRDITDWILGIIMIIFRGVVGFLIAAFIGFGISLMFPADLEWKKTETLELISLQDQSTTQGSFFLGIGSFDGSMQYAFYYKEDNSYKMGMLDYNEVSIKYTDSLPYIEKWEHKETDKKINNWAIDWAIDWAEDDRYIIYVKEGTINQNYNLDLN